MRDWVGELKCKVVVHMLVVEVLEAGASLQREMVNKQHKLVAAGREQVVLLRILEVDPPAAFFLQEDRRPPLEAPIQFLPYRCSHKTFHQTLACMKTLRH
jgi:hypothetical protein